MKYLKTLNAVQEKLDSLGDLPVFSATVNRISEISSSEKADAMALAMAVMKDANLSARLLRVANSSYCNRGHGRISVVSRAVVLLGFDQVKSLSVTLKLIENFKQSTPTTEISDLLIRSFLTASITREIAENSEVADVEESYICGLLYSLGEILVAYTLPGIYHKMLQQRKLGNKQWEHIQLDELGGHFSDIGQDIAQSWGFPQTVVHSMDLMTAEDQSGEVQSNYQLASSADLLLKLIYDQQGDYKGSFSELLARLETQTGQSVSKLTQYLNRSFKMACELADEYRLPIDALMPKLRDSGDDALDDFSRKVAYYMHSRAQAQDSIDLQDTDQSAETPAERSQRHSQLQSKNSISNTSSHSNNADQLLSQLQLIGNMVDDQQPIQKILDQVISAIETSTGFDRAGFCLLSKDSQHLNMRIAKGPSSEPLQQFFAMNRKQPEHLFFFKVLEKGMTLLVTDTQEANWGSRLPESFSRSLNPRGFILAPVTVGRKTIGFIYADRINGNEVVSDDDFRRFNQFFMLTKMSLAYSKQSQKK